MARLVTKFKYIQPGKRAGNYLRYIATRDGVEKIDDSKKEYARNHKTEETDRANTIGLSRLKRDARI